MRDLVFVPTYNERGNIEPLVRELSILPVDLLFQDDYSPDGTGDLLDALAKQAPHLTVLHAPKRGIGRAHKSGIAWARAHGYRRMATMDADGTHSVTALAALLAAPAADLVVGTRFARRDSTRDWPLGRQLLSRVSHGLHRGLFGLECDANQSFRRYEFARFPSDFVDRVRADGYAFFFESTIRARQAGLTIVDFPTVLGPRTTGTSKLNGREIAAWLGTLGRLAAERISE